MRTARSSDGKSLVRPLSRYVFDNPTAQQELFVTLCTLVFTVFSIRQTHDAHSIGGEIGMAKFLLKRSVGYTVAASARAEPSLVWIEKKSPTMTSTQEKSRRLPKQNSCFASKQLGKTH